MAHASLALCLMLAAVLLTAQWTTPANAMRAGDEFVDVSTDPAVLVASEGPQLYANKTFGLELAGVITELKCFNTKLSRLDWSTFRCVESDTLEISVTNCTGPDERYALYMDGDFCFFKKVRGSHIFYFISRIFGFMILRPDFEEIGVEYEGFNCDPASVLAGKPFTFEWNSTWAFSSLYVDGNCQEYWRLPKVENEGAALFRATFIKDNDEY